MSLSSARLPAGFESLEQFVDGWALAGAANRARLRLTSSEAEREAFYHAAKDVLPAALAYLDRKPLRGFDECDNRLMNLLLTLCHIAMAVEIQGDDEPRHAQVRKHLKITRAPADLSS
jgi:hypothetical protein